MTHKADISEALTRHQAIKVAWDAYVEASMDPANTNLEAMSAAIDAYDALSVEIREPAKVKPLEWADSDWAMVARVFGGHYEVFHKASTISKQGMQVAYISTSDDDEPAVLGDGKTLNDAQALAQAHHDSRIRSALITETDK